MNRKKKKKKGPAYRVLGTDFFFLVVEPISITLAGRQGLVPENVFLHLNVMFSRRTKRFKEFSLKIIRKSPC